MSRRKSLKRNTTTEYSTDPVTRVGLKATEEQWEAAKKLCQALGKKLPPESIGQQAMSDFLKCLGSATNTNYTPKY